MVVKICSRSLVAERLEKLIKKLTSLANATSDGADPIEDGSGELRPIANLRPELYDDEYTAEEREAMALMYTGTDVTKLLGPLALKVWTTVAGLACSILLSASFGMKLTAWIDACEKNLEAWDARRLAQRGAPS